MVVIKNDNGAIGVAIGISKVFAMSTLAFYYECSAATCLKAQGSGLMRLALLG
jgi:hypothetical protein